MYMDWFHSFRCSVILGVFVFVVIIMFFLFGDVFIYKGYGNSYRFCEFFGSFLPMIILFFILYPSLFLLYDYVCTGDLNLLRVGVVGHQWYWTYEYSDYERDLRIDSYILRIDDLSLGDYRLLDVDNRCVVPRGVGIRFRITSDDVIHSWSLPSMALKVDAIGGMMNRIVCNFPLVGVFYGQCSEICGAYHSFMPIVLEVTLPENFISWVVGVL